MMEFNLNSIWPPLLGGALIGLSATIMFGMLGRITGISGIVSSVLSKPQKEHNWRYAFILGLIFGGCLLRLISPDLFNYSLDSSLPKIIIAGLLVGFGTSLGSGCTSGHGVCGLPRFSGRSLTATLTFMGTGIIVVLLLRSLT